MITGKQDLSSGGGELDGLRRHEQRQVVGTLGFGGGLEDQPGLRLLGGDVGERFADGERVGDDVFLRGGQRLWRGLAGLSLF